MSKSSGSSSKSASGIAFVSHEMAGRFLAPLRLLGWAILLYCAVEVAGLAAFSLKLKNNASEWTFFTLLAERSWGYVLWGLALTLVVPAGPVKKWELLSLRLAHYLCAIGFVTCLILAPIGWIRWNDLRKEIVRTITNEQQKIDGRYRQLQFSLENETSLDRLNKIATVAGLQESVKDITNAGELNAELQRRLKLERDSKRDELTNKLNDNTSMHKLALVRSMGALGIGCLFMGLFWWVSRASRQRLMLPGEKRNSSEDFFPLA